MTALISSTLPIANALVALIKTFNNPVTGLPLYQEVKLGNIFDPSPFNTFCEVTFQQGQGGPSGSGGNQIGWRVEDEIAYLVTSGFGPYQVDSSACETSMLATRDILLPLLRQHFELPDMTNPSNAVQSVYRLLIQQPDSARVARFPNGVTYKMWNVFVLVSQQYNVALIQP